MSEFAIPNQLPNIHERYKRKRANDAKENKGDTNVSTERTFETHAKTSIATQVRREGSSRTTGRPLAVLHTQLRNNRCHATEVLHETTNMFRELILSSTEFTSHLQYAQQSYIEESKASINMMESTHNRMLSKTQQDTAEVAERTFYEMAPLCSPGGLRPRRPRPSFHTYKLFRHQQRSYVAQDLGDGDDRDERSKCRDEQRALLPSVLQLRQETVLNQQGALALALDEEAPKYMDPLPHDLYCAMITDIHLTNTKKKKNEKMATYTRWINGLAEVGIRPPAIGTIKNAVSAYNKSPANARVFPKQRVADTTNPKLYSLVLKEISAATKLNKTPTMEKCKEFIADALGKLANARGQNANGFSNSTNVKIIKTLRAMTKTTSKGDNVCSTDKRRRANCLQNAFGNYYLKRALRQGPCFDLTSEQTLKHQVEKYSNWNWDATTFIIKGGHQEDNELVFCIDDEQEHIKGANPAHSSYLPLRVKLHLVINAAGYSDTLYVVKLSKKDWVADDNNEDHWFIQLDTELANKKCNLLIIRDVKHKDQIECHYLFHKFLLPRFRQSLKTEGGWDGATPLDPLTQRSICCCDGEMSMGKVLQQAIEDGIMKQNLLRVGKPGAATTGIENIGQECDQNVPGFRGHKSSVKQLMQDYDQFKRMEKSKKRKQQQGTEPKAPDGITGAAASKTPNRFIELSKKKLFVHLKSSVTGATASLGIRFKKFDLLATLLYCCTVTEPKNYHQEANARAFGLCCQYPDDEETRVRALTTVDGFCKQTEAVRRKLMAPSFGKKCEQEFEAKDTLSKKYFTNEGLPDPDRGDTDAASIHLQAATELTGKTYQERVAKEREELKKKKEAQQTTKEEEKQAAKKNIEQIVKAGGLEKVLDSKHKTKKWLVKEIKAMAFELNVSAVGTGGVVRPKVKHALEILVAQAVTDNAIQVAAAKAAAVERAAKRPKTRSTTTLNGGNAMVLEKDEAVTLNDDDDDDL